MGTPRYDALEAVVNASNVLLFNTSVTSGFLLISA